MKFCFATQGCHIYRWVLLPIYWQSACNISYPLRPGYSAVISNHPRTWLAHVTYPVPPRYSTKIFTFTFSFRISLYGTQKYCQYIVADGTCPVAVFWKGSQPHTPPPPTPHPAAWSHIGQIDGDRAIPHSSVCKLPDCDTDFLAMQAE